MYYFPAMCPSPLLLAALRVLGAFVDQRPPDTADVTAIRSARPDQAHAPIDDLAREIVLADVTEREKARDASGAA